MRYLLDTNICIYFSKKNRAGVLEKLAEIPVADAGISVITYGELMYGAFKSARSKENLGVIEEFVESFRPMPLTIGAGKAYGQIKENLRASGRLISENDLWIAAHAVSESWTLVTNNVGEFKRIKGLKIENWAA